MFQTFRNAWKIPELKNRLLFTLAILVVYRLGSAIPVPFITSSALTQMFSNGNMLAYLDMMSGGALSRCTLFALGVTPYINASIIVQLLTVAIPSLENLAKEPDGQTKLQQITRYAGGIIGLVMSIGYYFVIRNMGALKYTSGTAGIFTAVVIIATFTAGAQLITWCGEQIDDKGIGNGLSLLIFSSIVSNWSSLYTTVAEMCIRDRLKDAGVPKIEIERTVDPSTSAPRVTVNIYCAKPGMVIGKGGEERVALQNKLTKEYGKTVIVNVIEVKSAATNAQLVAEDIARQLENRVTFRRAMKQCMRNAMSPRDRSTVPAKGIKAMCSGRLGGADIARTESYHEGTIPLQTLRADIDYGFAEAATTYGRIGVKVWVYKGEVLKSAKNAQKKEGGNK